MLKLLGLVRWILELGIGCFSVDGIGVDDFRLTGLREILYESRMER